jgi:hypothetical protein
MNGEADHRCVLAVVAYLREALQPIERTQDTIA